MDPYEMAGLPNPAQQMAMQEHAMPQTQETQGALSGIANQNAELARYMLDQEDILSKIENMLRGNIWTGRGWDKKGKQLMNDRGIRGCITFLSGFCHKSLITSIYSKEEIDSRMKHLSLSFNDFLFLNAEQYEIDLNDLEMIWNVVILGQIEPMYRRATNGKYLQFLGTTNKRIETFAQNSQPKPSGGLFGRLLGGGK